MPGRHDSGELPEHDPERDFVRRIQTSLLPHRLRCPSCLIPVDPNRVRVKRYDGTVREGTMPVRARFVPRALQRRAAEDDLIQTVDEGYVCDGGHPLPPHLFQIGLKPVALLGLSQSMKSHYIAAVSQQLLIECLEPTETAEESLVFAAIDETYALLQRDYLRLFDPPHREIPPTDPLGGDSPHGLVRDPVTFEVTYSSGLPPGRNRYTYVSLFDAPGEIFRTPRERSIHAPYLKEPAGLLLFVDAGSIAKVRKALGDEAPEYRSPIDPHVIRSAANSMRSGRPPLAPVDVPVSIVISRADLLQRSPAFSNVHPFLGGEPLLSDRANDAAREFLEQYIGGVAITTQRAFGSKVRYFFASATGCSPQNGEFETVEPWGCLGPLLWVLKADGFVTR